MTKILILAIVAIACSSANSVEVDIDKRIILKNDTRLGGVSYQIIEIDGVEYIAQYHGGISPLVKK